MTDRASDGVAEAIKEKKLNSSEVDRDYVAEISALLKECVDE